MPAFIFSISESIEMIWERPETRQIVSIGDILIDGDDIENFSVDRTESGSILIIARVHKSHEDQYKCRVATLQPMEVIHTMIVKPSQPLQQPLRVKNGSHQEGGKEILLLMFVLLNTTM